LTAQKMFHLTINKILVLINYINEIYTSLSASSSNSG
jgi:hypothetical protein